MASPFANIVQNARSAIFGPVSAPASQQVQTTGTGTPVTDTAPAVKTNETIVASPQDQFKDLWNTTPIDPKNAPISPTAFFDGVELPKMIESARNTNFVANINPELLTRAAAGGEDGVQALLSIINDVGQRAYATGAFASTKMTGKGLEHFDSTIKSRIPEAIKQNNFKTSLLESNPALNHPSAAPIIDAMLSKVAQKFPNASESELRALASSYLDTFAESITAPRRAASEKAKESSQEDWSAFIN